ncbi:hypothetical protein EVAR_34173_1 [Eumeta japonica]|uniref:Uncharacterized protein n=1 Tax=Eumeta variegata TaxID=151549 RepID=A0A4C1WKM4_EUMVA|nr:hypothetical protein EVAR_34173_1 [Eumeta japonica]
MSCGGEGISLGFERFGNCPKRFVGWFDFHEVAPTLISEFPNASFHFALESLRSGSVLGSGICSRGAKLRFCSYQLRISGGNFRRSEDAGTSRSPPRPPS